MKLSQTISMEQPCEYDERKHLIVSFSDYLYDNINGFLNLVASLEMGYASTLLDHQGNALVTTLRALSSQKSIIDASFLHPCSAQVAANQGPDKSYEATPFGSAEPLDSVCELL